MTEHDRHGPRAAVPAVPGFLDPPEVAKDDPQAKVKEIRYQAMVNAVLADQKAVIDAAAAVATGTTDLRKAEEAAQVAATAAGHANHHALVQAIFGAYLEVAKGNVDRARARAEFLGKAAATIAGFYTALLGLIYTVDASKGDPLPARGVLPTVFLAATIVLAVAYVAYVTKADPVATPGGAGQLLADASNRLRGFLAWATAPALERRFLLHAAIVSLACGVAFLPVAFVDISDGRAFGLAGWAGGAVLAVLAVSLVASLWGGRADSAEGDS